MDNDTCVSCKSPIGYFVIWTPHIGGFRFEGHNQMRIMYYNHKLMLISNILMVYIQAVNFTVWIESINRLNEVIFR